MLWILSGLGGDHRLYQRLDIPMEHRHIAWDQEFANCRSMSAFAQRCIDFGIQDGDFLIGSSFGGMVAAEISHLKRIQTCLLLGTAIRQIEINRLALVAGKWMRQFGGVNLQRIAQPFSYTGPKSETVRMFVEADSDIMENMFAAILNWRGCRPACPTERIHGRFDPVIPLRPSAHYDHIVNCTHLVALEAAQVCQGAINRLIGR